MPRKNRYRMIIEREGTDDLFVIEDTQTGQWIAHVPCWMSEPKDAAAARKKAKLVCAALNTNKLTS